MGMTLWLQKKTDSGAESFKSDLSILQLYSTAIDAALTDAGLKTLASTTDLSDMVAEFADEVSVVPDLPDVWTSADELKQMMEYLKTKTALANKLAARLDDECTFVLASLSADPVGEYRFTLLM